jgi:CO dehydrogenase nickel-insertion accessory protein CooC1
MEKTLGVEDSIPKTIIKLSYKKSCIFQQQCERHGKIKMLACGNDEHNGLS